MSLGQLVSPKAASPPIQPPNKAITHCRSYGKLPRLSKELMYESVQNQPVPRSPFSSPRPAPALLDSPRTTHGSLTPTSRSPSMDRSGSPTPRASRSGTMSSSESHHYTMSLPMMETSTEEDSSSWRSVFTRAKRGSRAFNRDDDLIEELAQSTNKSSQSKSKRHSKTSPATPTSPTFTDTATHAEERSRRRSSVFENLQSSFTTRFSNKRHSMGATSSQGDSPATPGQSTNGTPYAPTSEFGLPRDPFGKHIPPVAVSPRSRYPSLHRDSITTQEASSSSSPVSRGSPGRNGAVPNWVYPSPPQSPLKGKMVPLHDDQPLDSQPSPAEPSPYYVPVLGLNFPLPPSCTIDEVSEMSNRGIKVKETQTSVFTRQNIRVYDFAYDPTLPIYRSPTVGSPHTGIYSGIPRLPPGVYITKSCAHLDPALERRRREEQVVLEMLETLVSGKSSKKSSKSDNASRKSEKRPTLPNSKSTTASEAEHGQGVSASRRPSSGGVKRRSLSEAFAYGGSFFGRLTHA